MSFPEPRMTVQVQNCKEIARELKEILEKKLLSICDRIWENRPNRRFGRN